jgi:hypothetical protein
VNASGSLQRCREGLARLAHVVWIGPYLERFRQPAEAKQLRLHGSGPRVTLAQGLELGREADAARSGGAPPSERIALYDRLLPALNEAKSSVRQSVTAGVGQKLPASSGSSHARAMLPRGHACSSLHACRSRRLRAYAESGQIYLKSDMEG